MGIVDQIASFGWRTVLDMAALATATIVVLALGYWLLFRVVPRFHPAARSLARTLGGIRIQSHVLLPPEQLGGFFVLVLRTIQALAFLSILLIVLPLVWSVFPETQNLAHELLVAILSPLLALWSGFIQNLDNLIFILVVVVATRYVILALKSVFMAVGREQIVFKGFDAEWAAVTYQLVRFVTVALAIVVVFPYIPGSQTDAFRGVSVFVGVLVTLGSSWATWFQGRSWSTCGPFRSAVASRSPIPSATWSIVTFWSRGSEPSSAKR